MQMNEHFSEQDTRILSPPAVEPKTPIRLWIFNHGIRAITEQVEVFLYVMRTHGYSVTVSKNPSPSSLNVVIENFDEVSFRTVTSFCNKFRKRVAIIVTEHLDFINGQVYFHGRAVDAKYDDYMHGVVKRARLLYLTLLTEYTYCLLRLGDLPALVGIEKMFPGLPVFSLPFPPIVPAKRAKIGKEGCGPQFDLVFSGKVTEYRKKILARFAKSYRTNIIDTAVSRRCRDAANVDGRLVLNIPQREDWRWVSSMRVIAALRCRRATLSVNTENGGQIAPACFNVRDTDIGGARIRMALDNYETVYAGCADSYEKMRTCRESPKFPAGMLDVWEELEL